MITRFIKKLLKPFRKKDSSISFYQGYKLTSLPVVTFRQDEHKYNFLLDTGSTCNVIDAAVLKELKHEFAETKNSIYGMEGNKVEVPVSIIEFGYKNISFTYTYLVKDMQKAFENVKQETGVRLHGIIGASFFRAFKYILDFDKLEAYSKL